jgi:hypothetical protein
MFAILDKQTGKRYGQAHFINEVVDFIRSDKGRAPCYELIEGLIAKREGRSPTVRTMTRPDLFEGTPPRVGVNGGAVMVNDGAVVQVDRGPDVDDLRDRQGPAACHRGERKPRVVRLPAF